MRAVLIVVLIGLGGSASPFEDLAAKETVQVRDVGTRKQLFIDDRFIEARENVTLRLNSPQKLGIVLDSEDTPWENGTGGYFKVIDDRGVFKMYYGAFLPGANGLAYAESTDAIHWTKPALGIVEINGSTDNNVIYRDGTIDATIMVDPVDEPQRRYKIFRSKISDDPSVRGVYASYSAVGIHFTEAGRVFPMFPETSICAYWDGRIGKYVVFMRVLNVGRDNLRAIGRIETDDLLKPWPYNADAPPSPQPTPQHVQRVLATDAKDGPHCDFYTNAAYIYPYAQDVYLMFPTIFRQFTPATHPWFKFRETNGLLDVRVAVSRDGIHWTRPDRRPYFPMGFPDEWDRWLNMMGVGMVRKGNYLYQYYWSTGLLHDSVPLRPEYEDLIEQKNAIGAVRQRLDGFVSADAAYTGGWLTTPPIAFTGNRLLLNIDTGAVGRAFVEIRDIKNQPIPGYTLADCEEVAGNFIDLLVRWNGNADVSPLIGVPVKLHFTMRAAKLYAFQFTAESP